MACQPGRARTSSTYFVTRYVSTNKIPIVPIAIPAQKNDCDDAANHVLCTNLPTSGQGHDWPIVSQGPLVHAALDGFMHPILGSADADDQHPRCRSFFSLLFLVARVRGGCDILLSCSYR